jgi:hypothetical protein
VKKATPTFTRTRRGAGGRELSGSRPARHAAIFSHSSAQRLHAATQSSIPSSPSQLALSADMRVVLGVAHHEVDRDGANLRAIGHYLHVLWLRVLTARLKAVVHCHVKAGDMAFVAGVHASLHRRVHLVHRSFSICAPTRMELRTARHCPSHTSPFLRESVLGPVTSIGGLAALPRVKAPKALTLTRCQTLHGFGSKEFSP